MIQFLHPLYFLLIIPLLVIVVFLYQNGGKKVVFGPMKDLQNIFKTNTFYYKLYYFILSFIFLLYICIFSKPIISNVLEKQDMNGVDIQIVLDISYSMIAEDLKPNRLDVAKNVIGSFLDEISSDRIGVVIFAGKTFTSLPLNFDYKITKEVVGKITVDTINQLNGNMQGTAVGDALILASDAFGEDNNREKVIILLTDGEANRGLNPILALKYIQENNKSVKIYTIGIGGEKPTTVKIKDVFGEIIELPIGGVDEKTLKLISKETNGKYFRANNKETFKDIFDEISKIEKSELKIETLLINKEKNSYFVHLLILLFSSFILLKTRKKII